MGYKNKSWIKESMEAPYFALEKGIYSHLNVSAVGYVTGIKKDERMGNKVPKYIVKLGPIIGRKDVTEYTAYDVACLEHINITQKEIDSGTCIVMVAFLDSHPKNFYYQIHGPNKRIDDKLGNDTGVENILHDYRNGVIIGKLKYTNPIVPTINIPTLDLIRSKDYGYSTCNKIKAVLDLREFNPDTDMVWMYLYRRGTRLMTSNTSGNTLKGRKKVQKYMHPISEVNPRRPINIKWNGKGNRITREIPTEWVLTKENKGIDNYSVDLLSYDQLQELGDKFRESNNTDFVHMGFRVVRLVEGKSVPEMGPMTYCRLKRIPSYYNPEVAIYHNSDKRVVGEWHLELHNK